MKTKLNLLLIAILGVISVSCGFHQSVVASGEKTEVIHDITEFRGITASSGMDVNIAMGGVESVVVKAKENLHDYIEVYKDKDGYLKLKMKDNYSYVNTGGIDVYVSAKQIEGLVGSGGTEFEFKNKFSTDNLRVVLSGGGSLEADVECRSIIASLSGGSELELSGRVQSCKIDGSGGCSIEGYGFEADDLKLSLSGGGTARITVNKRINASLSGGSELKYKGDAVVESKSVSGGSSVTKQ